jgi:hypothetical protein
MGLNETAGLPKYHLRCSVPAFLFLKDVNLINFNKIIINCLTFLKYIVNSLKMNFSG